MIQRLCALTFIWSTFAVGLPAQGAQALVLPSRIPVAAPFVHAPPVNDGGGRAFH